LGRPAPGDRAFTPIVGIVRRLLMVAFIIGIGIDWCGAAQHRDHRILF
jgi:hypothetical protein